MKHTIENEYLRLEISNIGAEMHGLFNKKNNTQYLWDANPKYWDGHAYNLFPFCGRLWESKYTYKGKEYKMNLHGFARDSAFVVKEKSDRKISFELLSNKETFKIYPFEFKLTISYSLEGNKVFNNFIVEHTGEGKMYFSLGTHPGFFVPLQKDEVFEDYFLEFPEEQKNLQKLRFSETVHVLKGTDPVALVDNRRLPLTREMFDEANFYLNMSKSVALRSMKSDKAVILTYPDMVYLGLWQIEGVNAPYVCIEPWQGSPSYDGIVDDIETKRDMIALDAGGKWETYITIEIE